MFRVLDEVFSDIARSRARERQRKHCEKLAAERLRGVSVVCRDGRVICYRFESRDVTGINGKNEAVVPIEIALVIRAKRVGNLANNSSVDMSV